MNDLPIACTLSLETMAARRAGLLPGLAERAERREYSGDGVRLRFAASADTLQAIADVIDAERRCCLFLRFEVIVEQDGGPMWLTVTGPAGTREFLAELLEAR